MTALGALEHVREVRGVGMLGVEFDRDAASVQATAWSDGVIVRVPGTNVVLPPPLVITERLDTPGTGAERARAGGREVTG